MTPFELDILLHYYSCGGEHEAVRDNVMIWPETRTWFLENGLLEAWDGDHQSYRTTARANCLIEHILALPLPVWTMP